MALIPCPECSAPISDCARICPLCGYPLATKRGGAARRASFPIPPLGDESSVLKGMCPKCGWWQYLRPTHCGVPLAGLNVGGWGAEGRCTVCGEQSAFAPTHCSESLVHIEVITGAHATDWQVPAANAGKATSRKRRSTTSSRTPQTSLAGPAPASPSAHTVLAVKGMCQLCGRWEYRQPYHCGEAVRAVSVADNGLCAATCAICRVLVPFVLEHCGAVLTSVRCLTDVEGSPLFLDGLTVSHTVVGSRTGVD